MATQPPLMENKLKYENSGKANKEQMDGFSDQNAAKPIYMLNLLKYKDKAEYADGRQTQLSGADAYHVYSEAVTELLKEFGGEFCFSANVERLMLGEVEDLWDEVAIAMYPSRQAMAQMMSCDKMQEIGVHRMAGLAGQLNIEMNHASGTWPANEPEE